MYFMKKIWLNGLQTFLEGEFPDCTAASQYVETLLQFNANAAPHIQERLQELRRGRFLIVDTKQQPSPVGSTTSTL